MSRDQTVAGIHALTNRAGDLLVGGWLANRTIKRQRVFQAATDLSEEPALSGKPRLVGPRLDGQGGDQFQLPHIMATERTGSGTDESRGPNHPGAGQHRHDDAGLDAAGPTP